MVMKVFKALRDIIRTCMLCLWRMAYRDKPPLSLDRILHMRAWLAKVFCMKDVLSPLSFAYASRGYHGKVASLHSLINDKTELGVWSIDQKGIDLLWDMLEKKRPRAILEFGSGVSTLVIAAWIKESSVKDGVCISLDQDGAEAKKNAERLEVAGLSQYVKVITAHLNKDEFYSVDLNPHLDQVPGRSFDFVFVDGPAGSAGCRYNTLPIVRAWLAEEVTWVLHDALRDGEIDVIQKWLRMPGFSVDGFFFVGQGMATGKWMTQSKSSNP